MSATKTGIRCVSCDREDQLHYSTIRDSSGAGRRRGPSAPEGWICDECRQYHSELDMGMRMIHPTSGRTGFTVCSGPPPQPPTCSGCNISAVNGGSWKRTVVGGPWSCSSSSCRNKATSSNNNNSTANEASKERDLGLLLGSSSTDSATARGGPVGPITCPKSHPLVLFRLGASWTCDQCENNFESDVCCNRCESCDYDLCPVCVNPSTVQYTQGGGGPLTMLPKGQQLPVATWEVVYHSVRVRAGPSAEAAVVGSKQAKDQVQELQRSGKWIQIAPNSWMLTEDDEFTLLRKK